MALTVLHLIHGFGGGGAERQLSYLAPALAELGLVVHVGFVDFGVNFERIEKSVCRAHPVDASGNYDPRLYFRLARVVRLIAPDIVQTWLPKMDVLGGVLAIRNGIPLILTERNSSDAYGNGIKDWLRHRIGCRASAIIANSHQGLKYWSDIPEPTIKQRIPNGLDIEELSQFHDIREASGDIGNKPAKIVFAGRFTEAKNVSLITDAIIQVIGENNNILAAFYGEGPLKASVIDKVRRAGMQDRITIGGYTSSLWQHFSQASLVISLSKYEGNPNVVLEAAAIGCPLVLSDIPAHREIFRDSDVVYLKHVELADATTAIRRVLQDERASRRRADAARHRVCQMSIESCAKEYVNVYKEVLR